MTRHECSGGCGQVWEVFPVEDRDEDAAEFTIYATRTIPDGRFPVEEGASFYEADVCPTCEAPLDGILAKHGHR